MEYLALLVLGLLLGLQHAVEPDHLAAVGTLVLRRRNTRRVTRLGLLWGLGHAGILLAVGLSLYLLRLQIPEVWAERGEALAGGMLILLGFLATREHLGRRVHFHLHRHDEEVHGHFHLHAAEPGHDHEHEHRFRLEGQSLLVGIVHGLAGSGALLILAAASTHTLGGVLTLLLSFGAGSLIGMAALATALGHVSRHLLRYGEPLFRGVGTAAGLLSVILGGGMLFRNF